MELLSQTKYLIKKTGLLPDKLKGQNFCIDQAVISQLVKSASLTAKDTVLEVGPGLGFLTQELIKKAGRVIAVELDKKLFANLKNLTEANDNLEVIEADILKIRPEDLKPDHYKIVANLPFGITSAFLRKFLTADSQPELISLLLQKEVAERLCAPAGQMSLLAVSVQLYSRPKIITYVSKESFYPQPKVDSAIIQIKNIHPFPFSKELAEKKFWQTVKAGFCARRKTLENNLANSFHLSKEEVRKKLAKAGLKLNIRAQELSIGQWLKLAKLFN